MIPESPIIAQGVDVSAEQRGGARQVRVALLGCGTVGGAIARLLVESQARLRNAHGVDLHLRKVLVRSTTKPRLGVGSPLFTRDFDDVMRDEPHVIIEALGGRLPAASYVSRALERGISVVSTNKTLMAHEGPSLQQIADRTGARLAFEASVGAAVPILAALRQRRGDPIMALRAILNGTCNFVLCRMAQTGGRLETVLEEAIALGLAEPDPSADISGRDSAEKLCILAHIAGIKRVTPNDVVTSGIERVTPRDVQAAREQGCVIRLVAELDAGAGTPRLSVGPAFVPMNHPLAKAKGAENVFVLDQHSAGRLVLHGEGAGPKPTAAAILGDLFNVLAPGDARSSTASYAVGSDSSRRVYVRLPRSHPSADALRRRASHVEVRSDYLEAIIDSPETVDVADAFVARACAR